MPEAFGRLAGVCLVGVEDEIGGLPIQRATNPGHFLQSRVAIRCGKQWSRGVVSKPLQLLLDRGTQIHHEAAASEQVAILCQKHGTTAGCDQTVGLRTERAQRVVLAAPERALALHFEQHGDGGTRLPLDLVVGVKKRHRETLCQALADGAFARAHRADEDEIRRWIHAAMLALQADVLWIHPAMLRFFVLFIGLLTAMFSFRITEFAHEHFTLPFTSVLAAVSTFLITLFDKDVLATGDVIQSLSNGFAVQIAPGCDGIEAVIILIAALGAFPAPWRFKLYGAVIGFFAIQLLNIVRIISLFYLGQWDRVWFDWFHLYLWQALIILDELGVWLIWLRFLPKPPRRSATTKLAT